MISKQVLVLTLILLFFTGFTNSQAQNSSASYKVVHGWPKLPEGFILGAASAVAVDSHNHVWLFHRGKTRSIMAFEAETGKMVASFGDGMFIIAHGMAVDAEDNIWVTDGTSGTGASRHQVLKFSHDGKLLMTVGAEGVPGMDGTHFNQPTDIAIAANGDLFVSDGYVNRRVAKFNKDGQFLMDWGREGDGDGEFALPHGIALDSRGRIYVADRSNLRIQVFDGSNGAHLATWAPELMARPWGMEVGADGYLYVMDGGHLNSDPPDQARIIKMDLEGHVVTTFSSFGQQDGQIYWGHDVATGPDGAVYAVDVRGQRLQKFVPIR